LVPMLMYSNPAWASDREAKEIRSFSADGGASLGWMQETLLAAYPSGCSRYHHPRTFATRIDDSARHRGDILC
jgi:hypothetical protein